MAAHSTRTRGTDGPRRARAVKPRDQIAVEGGTSLTMLVLACHQEDTTGVDLASGALVRVRVEWPEEHGPDLAPFDVVETHLADEPERDDLAQPEAVTASGLPRHLGTLHGRHVRHLLHQLAAPVEEHVLGFPGASAPYWEFKGFRPSLALIEPTKGPVLFRRIGDRSAWVRFGWGRSDNWLPVEDPRLERALDVARRDRLQGKDLASALGFKPHYLVAAVSTPATATATRRSGPSCPAADRPSPGVPRQVRCGPATRSRSPTVGADVRPHLAPRPTARPPRRRCSPTTRAAASPTSFPDRHRDGRPRPTGPTGSRGRPSTPARSCCSSSTASAGNSSAARAALAPTLSAGAGIDRAITSVAPTTTAAALTSITTGRPPPTTGSSATGWPTATRS